MRVVSESLARQAVAKGGPAVTDIQVLERYNTPPPLGAGQAAYLLARSRVGGQPHYHFALVNTAPIDASSWPTTTPRWARPTASSSATSR